MPSTGVRCNDASSRSGFEVGHPFLPQLVPSMCEEKVNPSDPRDLDEPAAGECERRPSARQEVPGQSLFQRGKAVLEL